MIKLDCGHSTDFGSAPYVMGMDGKSRCADCARRLKATTAFKERLAHAMGYKSHADAIAHVDPVSGKLAYRGA